MNFKKFAGPILLIFFMGVAVPAFSQVTTKQTNNNNNNTNNANATIRHVDDLTDEQLLDLIARADAQKLTDEQLAQLAVQRGLPASETQKFIDRITRLRKDRLNKNTKDKNNQSQQPTGRSNNGNDLSVRDTVNSLTTDTLTAAQKADIALRKKIFGGNIFANKNISFEPNMRLATPRNYQIGPDDQILIDIYGNSEVSYNLVVSPEGTINVPSVGVIPVSGMTVEQASARIKNQLSKIYRAILTGQTAVSIAIGNIRSIKVTLTGEVVAPSTYTVSSLATVANALYLSGGPTVNGSFRQIELIRAGHKIATLDVYDFIMNGTFRNNPRLQDQDVIRVPPYANRIEMIGEVKHPGLFELIPGEKFRDVLKYAGGFTDSAYRARIKILKNTDTERQIVDLTSDHFDTYQPGGGDKIYVDQILARFTNRVSIDGAVFRPGQYELDAGMTVKQLIGKAEGLREDAFMNRATILRQGEDLQPVTISFNPAMILSGVQPDIPLKKEDQISVASIFGLIEYFTVQINGEVQNPGTYNFSKGMTLEDVILQAGNFKEGATSNSIEVARRVKNSNALSASAEIAQVFTIDANHDLKSASANFVLEPFDIISVRPSSGYEVQRLVRITGEILHPGLYALSKKDERVSDIIKRAGGFTAQAYADGASLERQGPTKNKEEVEKISREQSVFDFPENLNMRSAKELNARLGDTTSFKNDRQGDLRSNLVGIDLPAIIKKPGTKEDIFLEDGDLLHVPKQLQTVKVNGEVLSPRTVVFSKFTGCREYISSAGGFTQKARKRNTYVQYANGSVRSTKKILFFNSYPSIKPGAEIFIPSKEDKRGISATEIVGLTSGLASLGAIILGILNLSKN